MYSKNDYRYYLERQLIHSDDFLAHYGVVGMKWGVRKDAYTRLSERRASNDAKIAKYKEKLSTTGSKNRSAKAAKYKAKQDKYDKKAAKARAKLARGKVISRGEVRKIAKAENYRHKVAKNSIKNDKYQSKINKFEAKNAKIDKKISKLKNKENREKLPNNTKSDIPTKADIINRAKVYNMYDLSFLETVQNKNLNEDQTLKEYKKYLDDPHKYRTQTVKKLKDY